MWEILKLIGITLLPFLELRASIPYGVFATELPPAVIFFTGVVVNIIIAPVVYFFLNNLVHLFLKIKKIDQLYQRTVLKAQKKLHPYVEKYGVLGLAVFIGIPLPGTGVYSGTLAAYVLGFKFKDLMMATIIGVLISGTIVLLASVAGDSAWNFLIKKI